MPQLLSPRATTSEAGVPRARAPQQEKPPQWEARAPQLEKACAQQRRPNTAKNKLIKKNIDCKEQYIEDLLLYIDYMLQYYLYTFEGIKNITLSILNI